MTSARLSGSNAPPSAHIKLLDDRRFRALLSDGGLGSAAARDLATLFQARR
ncbi:tartrate dehydratase alpha subunit/fumarate hydratase class I-like protein [Bradyrhizobium sp. GM24.11]